jgi:hypothetical protein
VEHKAGKVFKDLLVFKVHKVLQRKVLGGLKELLVLVVDKVLKVEVVLRVFKDRKVQIQQAPPDIADHKVEVALVVLVADKVLKDHKVQLVFKAEVEVRLLLVIVFCHIIIGMLVKLVVLHSLAKMATVIQEYLIRILGVILTLLFGTYRIKTRRVMLTADGLVVLCPSIKHTNIDLLHG